MKQKLIEAQRRAQSISTISADMIKMIRILMLDKKIEIDDGLNLTEQLHAIREAALQIK